MSDFVDNQFQSTAGANSRFNHVDANRGESEIISEPGSSVEIFQRYLGGEDHAATELFERYMERLTRLARRRLSPRLASRTDPEDVVLSVWRSFFVTARTDRFTLKRSGDLWRLLAKMTVNKAARHARHHAAARRSILREQTTDPCNLAAVPYPYESPPAEEAVLLAEQLQAIFSRLDTLGRRILERRLQGHSHAEIASDCQCSQRSVRRRLAEVRQILADQLEDETS